MTIIRFRIYRLTSTDMISKSCIFFIWNNFQNKKRIFFCAKCMHVLIIVIIIHRLLRLRNLSQAGNYTTGNNLITLRMYSILVSSHTKTNCSNTQNTCSRCKTTFKFSRKSTSSFFVICSILQSNCSLLKIMHYCNAFLNLNSLVILYFCFPCLSSNVMVTFASDVDFATVNPVTYSPIQLSNVASESVTSVVS